MSSATIVRDVQHSAQHSGDSEGIVRAQWGHSETMRRGGCVPFGKQANGLPGVWVQHRTQVFMER